MKTHITRLIPFRRKLKLALTQRFPLPTLTPRRPANPLGLRQSHLDHA